MIPEERTDLHSALLGAGLGPLRLNPVALTSSSWIYGNCGHPSSPAR